MDNVEIKESLVSPKVVLNKDSGIFEIRGNSYMSNPTPLYELIENWLKEYVGNPPAKTVFSFDMEYVNTATVKLLSELIKLLVSIRTKEKEIVIKWCCSDDDEDMLELGKQFEKINNFKFEWTIR